MTDAEGAVRVDGTFTMESKYGHSDYLKEGTVYVSGDFRQIGTGRTVYVSDQPGYNYSASANHVTVLNGTEKQTVNFESSDSHFGTLKITKNLENYEFTPNPCWTTLIQPEIPEFGEPEMTLPAAVTVIEESAFEGTAAGVVYIPDTCTSVGSFAFRDSAVTRIRIPANCALGEDVFSGCEKVFIFGTAGSPAEEYCNTHDNCTFVAEE